MSASIPNAKPELFINCLKTQFILDKFMRQSRSPSLIISQSIDLCTQVYVQRSMVRGVQRCTEVYGQSRSNYSVGAFWIMPHAHTFLRKSIRYFGIEAEFSPIGDWVECFLTRALLGGGRLNAPLRFFEASENAAARSAAGFSPSIPPSFPQLLWKFRPNAMSGQVTRSGQVTQLQK